MTARILIVDDTAFMRRMLRDILLEAQFEVVAEAANGQEAVDLYVQEHPDLVIMDITMPQKDGLAAVQEILAQDPQARIVMCSALGQQDMIMRSLEAGALDFVQKPFLPDKVLEAVGKVLGS
ncbi:MAG: response regulator [Chloroflexia bacterium]|nr:response regulator [Chloroflexia bacterium]